MSWKMSRSVNGAPWRTYIATYQGSATARMMSSPPTISNCVELAHDALQAREERPRPAATRRGTRSVTSIGRPKPAGPLPSVEMAAKNQAAEVVEAPHAALAPAHVEDDAEHRAPRGAPCSAGSNAPTRRQRRDEAVGDCARRRAGCSPASSGGTLRCRAGRSCRRPSRSGTRPSAGESRARRAATRARSCARGGRGSAAARRPGRRRRRGASAVNRQRVRPTFTS